MSEILVSKALAEQPRSSNGALPDIQNSSSPRPIALWKAGVRDVKMPLLFQDHEGAVQPVHATAAVSVGLDRERRGANMSRFIEQMAEWSRSRPLSLDLREFLEETRRRLQSESAHVDLEFRYYIEKAAPVSGLRAPMGYDVRLDGALERRGSEDDYRVSLGLEVEASNCCPCSKAISDYGAHNQRIRMRLDAALDTRTDLSSFSLEDLISELEESSSCAVYPVLKRPDEKYVTERQYENPKFVEDVARDAVHLLRNYPGVAGFTFRVEALESIHGHNAWAAHSETVVEQPAG